MARDSLLASWFSDLYGSRDGGALARRLRDLQRGIDVFRAFCKENARFRDRQEQFMLVLQFAQDMCALLRVFAPFFAGICASFALEISARFGDLRVLPLKSK